jgi:hypothetical protein
MKGVWPIEKGVLLVAALPRCFVKEAVETTQVREAVKMYNFSEFSVVRI